jgi:hypothetical protein
MHAGQVTNAVTNFLDAHTKPVFHYGIAK